MLNYLILYIVFAQASKNKFYKPSEQLQYFLFMNFVMFVNVNYNNILVVGVIGVGVVVGDGAVNVCNVYMSLLLFLLFTWYL